MRATIIVPKVTCRQRGSLVSLLVGIGTTKESAAGVVEIDCQGPGRAQDHLFVYTGSAGAVRLPADVVHPGNRVRVTASEENGRLFAEASIAGRRLVHSSAKGGPVSPFEIGAFDRNPDGVSPGRVLVRDATSDGKPIGAAADVVRTTQAYHGKIVLVASRLRRGRSFTIRTR